MRPASATSDRYSAGLERGIGMNPLSNDLNIAVTVFWVFYIISELPSVMLGKKLGLVRTNARTPP